MRVNDPAAGRALWLRFTLLLRGDGSKRIAETWAISFRGLESGGVERIGGKDTYAISEFRVIDAAAGGGFEIANCAFSDSGTRGEVSQGGHTIRWAFQIAPGQDAAFDLIPASLRKVGIKNMAVNVHEDVRFDGWSEVDGVRHEWHDAPAMQGHLAGPKNGHHWVWAHCSRFVDAQGAPAPLLFDGICAHARLGKRLASPKLTTMYLRYEGQEYIFNRLGDALTIESRYEPACWEFRARHGELTFTGRVEAGDEQFAGVTYEDTDGSGLYCHNAKMADMTLVIQHKVGRELTYRAKGTVAFEYVVREQRPEIPFVI